MALTPFQRRVLRLLADRRRSGGGSYVAGGTALNIDARKIVKELTAKFGGRGGGKPDLAQGGGLTASIDDCLAYARGVLAW